MSDDVIRTMGVNGRGTIRARAPGRAAPRMGAFHDERGKRYTSPGTHGYHALGLTAGVLPLSKIRAQIVRDAIRDVARVLGVSKEYARARLAKLLKVSSAQVVQWGEHGIGHKRTWARWCAAVDALTEPVRGPKESRGVFGARFRKARKSIGLSLRELSEALGKSYWTIRAWECGDRCPKNDVTQNRILAEIERLKRKKAG